MKGELASAPLGRVCKIFNGNSINTEYKRKHFCGNIDGYPYIATKDVSFNGDINYDNGVHIPAGMNYKIAPKGSVFICAEGGSAGKKIAKNSQDVCFGNKLFCLIPNEKIDNEFLYLFLLSDSFKFQFKEKISGLISGVSAKKFNEIIISYPSIEEQRAIVSKINTEFTAIDQIKQNAANSLEEAKSLFCSTLEDAIRQRADWRKVRVSEIATEMYRGSGIKRDQVTKDGTPCVRYGEIYTSYNYSFSECISHTQESLISSKKYFEHGDILFAITGESVEDIGKCVAYTGNEKCLLGGDIIAMKHHENPKFLAYALSTKEAIRQKGKGKTKLKVVHTNYADLRDISINLPKDLSEQSSIAAKLDTVFNYVKQVENNCAEISKNCTELKQSILRDIFN